MVVGGVLSLDLLRVPEKQASARAAVALIGVYQTTISPVLSRTGVRCRFVPSCSEYARASIQNQGLAAGGLRSVTRLARCGPWTPAGTADPVAVGLLAPAVEHAAKRRP